MSGATTSVAYPKLVQVALCITFTLVFLASIGRYILYPNDRSRCHSMLNDGWWLDRDKHTKWQPAGCMMHTYDAPQISTCLNHSRVLYVGDSIARTQFFSFVKLIRPDADTSGERHSDRLYEFNDLHLTLEFWWDPYLNTTRTIDMLKTINPATQPSLLVMGSGAWYMRYLDTNYREDWQDAMDRVFDAVQRSSRVADAVILSPVEVPHYDLLSPERSRTMSIERVDSMNAYLKSREESLDALTPLVVPFVWNKMTYEIDDITEDGLHFDTPTTTMQIQLALNYRCNNQLPKHFPLDSTCCFQYPSPKWYQTIYFVFFLAWIPLGLYVISSERGVLTAVQRLFPSEKVLDALFIFGLGVIYMYFGDRTQIFGKAQKNFDPIAFGALCLAALAAGILTLKSKREGDQGFLNRDQTDEWKGWMQVIILIYHFLGASSISSIYNPIRVLVAAYLFQTGYGHFFFFYKKADFGLSRVLNVMVRLNLLTFVLQYVMATDYLSYYFTPLVSFWFLVIWLTMYMGHRANTTPWFLLCKIAVASILTTILIHVPGLLEDIFNVLRILFNVDWNATEWRFRLGLDAWIVYIGMLFAFGTIKFTEHRLYEHPSYLKAKKLTLIASVIAMVAYFIFELSCANKIIYNHYHPYISWIPILAFIALRNATVKARNTSSKFFIFFGRISLETFIGQFHMWLAGDTKGLLVVLAHPSAAQGMGWWLNLVVSSALFVFVCHHLSQSTGVMTKWICSALGTGQNDNRPRSNQQEYQAVPLLPTSTREGADNGAQDNNTKNNQQGETAQENGMTAETIAQEEDWNEESVGAVHKPSLMDRLRHFQMDARIKVVLLLLSIGLVNRLC